MAASTPYQSILTCAAFVFFLKVDLTIGILKFGLDFNLSVMLPFENVKLVCQASI